MFYSGAFVRVCNSIHLCHITGAVNTPVGPGTIFHSSDCRTAFMVNVWFRILQDQIKMLIQDLLYKIAVSIRANVFFSRCNFNFFSNRIKRCRQKG